MKSTVLVILGMIVAVPVYGQALSREQCEAMADIVRGVAMDRDTGVSREREIRNLKEMVKVNAQIRPMERALITTINNVYDSPLTPAEMAGKAYVGCEKISGESGDDVE